MKTQPARRRAGENLSLEDCHRLSVNELAKRSTGACVIRTLSTRFDPLRVTCYANPREPESSFVRVHHPAVPHASTTWRLTNPVLRLSLSQEPDTVVAAIC